MTRAVALLGLWVAACGQPPADTPAPATSPESRAAAPAEPERATDPPLSCEVLDPVVVSDAAGEPMRITSAPGTSGCSLSSVPPNLVIEGMALPRSEVFDRIAGHEAAERIAGVADAAYFVQVEGRTLGQLHVVRGGRMLVVTLRAETEGPDLRAIAGRLAPAVAERL